jgi:hypothetical protein
MTATLATEVLQDDIAVSLARVMAAANKRARELGVDIADSLITITQEAINGDVLWRVNYGPKSYLSRRGGDLIIDVDPRNSNITRVLEGQ